MGEGDIFLSQCWWEMKHIGEVSGNGENPRRSKKYSHFIYYILSCEHVYLSFHAALSWLQWLSLTKLLPLGRHRYRHLSRTVTEMFINASFLTEKPILYFQFTILYCPAISSFEGNPNACTSFLLCYSNLTS